MFKLARLTVFALTCAAIAVSAPLARAAEELSVLSDQSQIIKLDKAPGTIVVGNPSIADVTIQGSELFVHGRAFGKTNLIILDDSGNVMAQYNVNVNSIDDNAVTVFKASQGGMVQATYTCKVDCESALHVGDDVNTFNNVLTMQKGKLGIAQGQKSGESATPGTPDQSQ